MPGPWLGPYYLVERSVGSGWRVAAEHVGGVLSARFMWVLAEIRQLIEAIWRASASVGKIQPMFAQFVVQGFAGYAQGFGQAA